VLQLQENNRLEILKRRWWEGGQCPKEEDHRAKGMNLFSAPQSNNFPSVSSLLKYTFGTITVFRTC